MKSSIMLAFCIVLIGCSDGKSSLSALLSLNEIESTVSRPELFMTLPGSWDENWFSSVVAYDLDNDKQKEIVASRHSVVYVWNSDGTLKWRTPVGENSSTNNDHGNYRMYCSPVVGDLDGDGLGEIAICYSNKAAVYDHNGYLQSGWPQTFPGLSGELRSIASADLDNDRRMEILVVKTGDGPVTHVWKIDGQLFNGWPQVTDKKSKNDYGGYNQNIGCADLDGDGQQDIVATYDLCHIGVFYHSGESWKANSMFKGIYSCNVPMFHDIELAKQGWGADLNDRDEFTDSPPAFADIDNDGLNEIVLFSDHERAGEYINRGNSLWVLNPDMSRVKGFEKPITTGMPLFSGYRDNIVQIAPSPALSKFGTSNFFVVVPSYDGYLRCFDHQGSLYWKVQFDASGAGFTGASECAIADLNNDAQPEIVFCTYSTERNSSHLFILSKMGSLLHRVALPSRGCMAAPTIGDINNDGKLELLISLKDALGKGLGGVQIYTVESAVSNSIDWGTGRGNYFRTGEHTTK